MSAQSNKELLQRIFAELAVGNSRPLVEAMADDFRWVVAGSSRWSRTFAGKQAVLTQLFPVLRHRIADRVRTEATRFVADGDVVVVEARGHNTTRDGVPYNNNYCMIYTVRDGRLHELVEYMDTELALKALGDPDVLLAASSAAS
jgi:ketosteroid isomerase-like protein